eukprot:TRINITY_DN8954_c0_g1_i8.p1 TRINITY_DN8954_c0_g1~~TRINITY_DN8954_c0_g1_i8.p1  ORF type:complete len:591 (-),score=174.80 TRINITY_DN8954_c0_g1_i8:311-1939(-)
MAPNSADNHVKMQSENKTEAADGSLGAIPKQSKPASPPSSPQKSENNSSTNATPNKSKKRRRTRSRNPSLSPSPGRGFVVPGFTSGEGQNAKMTVAELMDASKGITNMALAHEIAVDKDFQLTKLEPANPMETTIKEIMQRAFWDVLSEELESDPPVYKQAMQLFREVKALLISVLLPQHGKLKEKIEETLDLDLIQQQIDAGTLEFEKYAGYILGVMGMLCAPVRDEKIAELKSTSQIVPLFKGILDTLELMKIDMANFTIQQARPLIVSKSVEYEKKKFQEFLDTVDDGLISTREWLVRHAPTQEEIDDPKYKKLLGARVLNEAFVEILEWDDYYHLPETLTMDAKRIVSLRDQVERTSVSTATILVSFSLINQFVVPQDSQKLKEKLKQNIDILLQDFFEDSDLLKLLPNVGLQVVKDVNDYLATKSRPALTKEISDALCQQIEGLEDPNQRIRDIVQKRIIEFNKQIISGGFKQGMQVPPGLTLCQQDLAAIAGQFVRLVNYNKQVFGEHYDQIIQNHCLYRPPPSPNTTAISPAVKA